MLRDSSGKSKHSCKLQVTGAHTREEVVGDLRRRKEKCLPRKIVGVVFLAPMPPVGFEPKISAGERPAVADEREEYEGKMVLLGRGGG